MRSPGRLTASRTQDGGPGDEGRVRESRIAFQAATQTEFIKAVEEIVYRKVRAFGSAVDPDANVVFENFYFEPRESGSDGEDTLTAKRAS